MALFQGEDLVPVVSPDGRTLQLPRSLVPASMMPQQFGTPAPVTDEIAGAPPLEIPSVTGGQLPTVPQDVAPPAQTPPPEYNLGTVDIGAIEKQQAALAKQQQAQARARAQYEASAPGQMEAAQRQQQDAYAAESQAAKDAALVEAAAQTTQAEAKEEWNTKIDQAIGERATAMAEQAQREQQKYAEVESLGKKIANTKIDRSADHPIIAAIGIALAGLGSAMKGESTNPAIEVYWKAIDRKVAGQMADLDQMGKVYGMTKDELATLKDAGQNRLALHNTLIAAELDKSQRHLDALAARTSSERTKANIPVLQAQIAQRSAAARTAAVQSKLEYEQKERQHAESQKTQRYGIAVQDRHAKEQEKIAREGMVLDWDKATLQAGAAREDAQAKARLKLVEDNETRGIRNVNTKEPLLTPRGRAMMQDADRAEARAAEIERAAKASVMGVPTGTQQAHIEALRSAAANARAEAEAVHMVRHRDPTQAGRLAEEYTGVQSVTNNVDAIKMLYDGPDGGKAYIYNSPVQQEIASRYVQVLMELKNVHGLGVLSAQDSGLLKKEMGMDPTSEAWTEGNLASVTGVRLGKDPEGFKRALDSIISNAQEKVYLKMNGTNFGGTKKELFYGRTAPTVSPEGKALSRFNQERTPMERAEEERSKGTVRKVLDRVVYDAFTTNEERAQGIEQSGSTDRPGFSKNQAQDFDTLVQSYRSGKPEVGNLIIGQVVNDATRRPELALATMRNLRQHEPDLYKRALPALQGPVAEQLSSEDKIRIGLADEGLAKVAQLAAIGNKDAQAEVARRASTDGHPEQDAARKVLHSTIFQTFGPTTEGMR